MIHSALERTPVSLSTRTGSDKTAEIKQLGGARTPSPAAQKPSNSADGESDYRKSSERDKSCEPSIVDVIMCICPVCGFSASSPQGQDEHMELAHGDCAGAFSVRSGSSPDMVIAGLNESRQRTVASVNLVVTSTPQRTATGETPLPSDKSAPACQPDFNPASSKQVSSNGGGALSQAELVNSCHLQQQQVNEQRPDREIVASLLSTDTIEANNSVFIQKVDSRRRYRCNICPVTFPWHGDLTEHLRLMHGMQKSRENARSGKAGSFCCSHCKYVAKYQSELRRHMRLHWGVKPFVCVFCPYRSAWKGDLKRHMESHHREKFNSEVELAKIMSRFKNNAGTTVNGMPLFVSTDEDAYSFSNDPDLSAGASPPVRAYPSGKPGRRRSSLNLPRETQKTEQLTRSPVSTGDNCSDSGLPAIPSLTYQREETSKQAMKEVDEQSPLRCTPCSFPVSTPDQLSGHVVSHHPDALIYKCPLCTYVDFDGWTLKEHVKSIHQSKQTSLLSARPPVVSVGATEAVMDRHSHQHHHPQPCGGFLSTSSPDSSVSPLVDAAALVGQNRAQATGTLSNTGVVLDLRKSDSGHFDVVPPTAFESKMLFTPGHGELKCEVAVPIDLSLGRKSDPSDLAQLSSAGLPRPPIQCTSSTASPVSSVSSPVVVLLTSTKPSFSHPASTAQLLSTTTPPTVEGRVSLPAHTGLLFPMVSSAVPAFSTLSVANTHWSSDRVLQTTGGIANSQMSTAGGEPRLMPLAPSAMELLVNLQKQMIVNGFMQSWQHVAAGPPGGSVFPPAGPPQLYPNPATGLVSCCPQDVQLFPLVDQGASQPTITASMLPVVGMTHTSLPMDIWPVSEASSNRDDLSVPANTSPLADLSQHQAFPKQEAVGSAPKTPTDWSSSSETGVAMETCGESTSTVSRSRHPRIRKATSLRFGRTVANAGGFSRKSTPDTVLKEEQWKRYQCSGCGHRSNWKWDINKHIKVAHPERKNIATLTLDLDEARRTFGDYMNRLKASRTRSANELAAGVSLPHSSVSLGHYDSHGPYGMSGEGYYRPFKCSVCGHRSNWKWDVRKHIKQMHNGAADVMTLSLEEARRTIHQYKFCRRQQLRHTEQQQQQQEQRQKQEQMGPGEDFYQPGEDLKSEPDQREQAVSEFGCAPLRTRYFLPTVMEFAGDRQPDIPYSGDADSHANLRHNQSSDSTLTGYLLSRRNCDRSTRLRVLHTCRHCHRRYLSRSSLLFHLQYRHRELPRPVGHGMKQLASFVKPVGKQTPPPVASSDRTDEVERNSTITETELENMAQVDSSFQQLPPNPDPSPQTDLPASPFDDQSAADSRLQGGRLEAFARRNSLRRAQLLLLQQRQLKTRARHLRTRNSGEPRKSGGSSPPAVDSSQSVTCASQQLCDLLDRMYSILNLLTQRRRRKMPEDLVGAELLECNSQALSPGGLTRQVKGRAVSVLTSVLQRMTTENQRKALGGGTNNNNNNNNDTDTNNNSLFLSSDYTLLNASNSSNEENQPVDSVSNRDSDVKASLSYDANNGDGDETALIAVLQQPDVEMRFIRLAKFLHNSIAK